MEKQQALASMEDEDAAMASAVAQSQSESTGPSTSQATTTSSVSPYPEEGIQKIISAGFSREKALQALQQFNGDVQQALVFLIARSLTV